MSLQTQLGTKYLVDNMSGVTYHMGMNPTDKRLLWLGGEVKTPPMGTEARIETGYLLRRLQAGDLLAMPQSRPMPSIGARCHELRVNDEDSTWRILYRLDDDAVVVAGVFKKKTGKTPKSVIDKCKTRLKRYDANAQGEV